IQQLLNNLVTLWFFMSPIVYCLADLNLGSKPKIISIVMDLNPMKHIMVAYHRTFLQHMSNQGSQMFNLQLPWVGLAGVFIFSTILLIVSWRIFNNLKSGFSEEI
ncbi:hypothetical protein K8T06_05300, partial [bacterium]|nr:hypothetical protein [bacterium]